MSRRVWFLPVAILIALAAYLGLRSGQPLTETEAITFYAGQYVNDFAGTRDHCAATPSQRDGIWIEVVCIAPDKMGVIYLVAPNGRLSSSILIRDPSA